MPSVSRVSSVQSAQKWDDMFQCLVKFIEETRLEQTKGLSEEEKALWVWDVSVFCKYDYQNSWFLTRSFCLHAGQRSNQLQDQMR
jgi:hypothetical protein